jgi:hypothetical protein
MKRDPDLIRLILLEIEKTPAEMAGGVGYVLAVQPGDCEGLFLF